MFWMLLLCNGKTHACLECLPTPFMSYIYISLCKERFGIHAVAIVEMHWFRMPYICCYMFRVHVENVIHRSILNVISWRTSKLEMIYKSTLRDF
jgi:hypothetical protein